MTTPLRSAVPRGLLLATARCTTRREGDRSIATTPFNHELDRPLRGGDAERLEDLQIGECRRATHPDPVGRLGRDQPGQRLEQCGLILAANRNDAIACCGTSASCMRSING